MSVINNKLYNTAAAGYTPLNGMYIFYGTSISTPSSGATIDQIVSAIKNTTGAGMARCSGIASSAGSGAVVTSGAVTSGDVVYIGTTANAEVVAGVALTPGLPVNALGVANLHPNIYTSNGTIQSRGYLKDTLLDYTPVSGGIVLPAGGYVTLVDNITVSGGNI